MQPLDILFITIAAWVAYGMSPFGPSVIYGPEHIYYSYVYHENQETNRLSLLLWAKQMKLDGHITAPAWLIGFFSFMFAASLTIVGICQINVFPNLILPGLTRT